MQTIPHSHKSSFFRRFCAAAATGAGHPAAFLLAFLAIVVWAVTGPMFGFSDTWQLIINTSTTIVTFLMVFLIQNAQNRDTAAMQIKLDELIRAVRGARNNLIDIEQLDERELCELREKFSKLAAQARDEKDRAVGAGG